MTCETIAYDENGLAGDSVGARDFVACNEIAFIAGEPITSIYCILKNKNIKQNQKITKLEDNAECMRAEDCLNSEVIPTRQGILPQFLAVGLDTQLV